MKKREKPDILKTFTEFTIEELRVMPMRRVFALFLKEVRATFRGQSVRAVPKKKPVKKNPSEPILTASVKKSVPKHALRFRVNTIGLQQAMKRVLTPGPVKMVNVGKADTVKHGKNGKKETIVFTKPNSSDQSAGKIH